TAVPDPTSGSLADVTRWPEQDGIAFGRPLGRRIRAAVIDHHDLVRVPFELGDHPADDTRFVIGGDHDPHPAIGLRRHRNRPSPSAWRDRISTKPAPPVDGNARRGSKFLPRTGL